MRILFFTAELGGNVPPVLAVANELASRGAEVEVIGLGPGRTVLRQPAFGPATALQQASGRKISRGLATLRLLAGRRTVLEAMSLLEERRPDVVVIDCMAPAFLAGTLRTGLPVVVLFHTVSEYWVRSFDRGPIGRILALLGMRPRTLWERADARLLTIDRELDPQRDAADLAEWAWTGTTESGVEPLPRAGSPRVLVTLSSTPFPGMVLVYQRIIAALAELPIKVVVTTGGVDLGRHLEGATNTEILGWADHHELLPTMDLVMGHGGYSTTMKTLAHGLPLIILPINPISDQRLVGEAVQAAGCGATMPKTSSAKTIRAVVERMLADEALRERTTAAGHRLRSRPSGAKVAADQILSIVSTRS